MVNIHTIVISPPECAVVVHEGEEVQRLVQADGRLIETDFPANFKRLLGPRSILFSSGKKHTTMRRILNQVSTPSDMSEEAGRRLA